MKAGNTAVKCAYCKKGRIVISDHAQVNLSVVCHICKREFIADLKTGRSYKKSEYMRKPKIRPFDRIYHCPEDGCSGQIRADGEADAYVSAKCPKCRQFFVTDLYEGTVEDAQAVYAEKLNA